MFLPRLCSPGGVGLHGIHMFIIAELQIILQEKKSKQFYLFIKQKVWKIVVITHLPSLECFNKLKISVRGMFDAPIESQGR